MPSRPPAVTHPRTERSTCHAKAPAPTAGSPATALTRSVTCCSTVSTHRITSLEAVFMTRSRWFAVGQASGSDAEPARRAADQALVGSDPSLLIVFCSESLDLVEIGSSDRPPLGGRTADRMLDGGRDRYKWSGRRGRGGGGVRRQWLLRRARRSLGTPRATLGLLASTSRVVCQAPTTGRIASFYSSLTVWPGTSRRLSGVVAVPAPAYRWWVAATAMTSKMT